MSPFSPPPSLTLAVPKPIVLPFPLFLFLTSPSPMSLWRVREPGHSHCFLFTFVCHTFYIYDPPQCKCFFVCLYLFVRLFVYLLKSVPCWSHPTALDSSTPQRDATLAYTHLLVPASCSGEKERFWRGHIPYTSSQEWSQNFTWAKRASEA